MVYVQDKNGNPLMPTNRHGKVRRLLDAGKAKVVYRTPFTIRLQYETTNYVQDVTLGVDAGTVHVGVSASTEKKELFSGEAVLRNDVVKKMATRAATRRTRRYKLRYRPKRFDNRVKEEGWLAPSTKQKEESHINIMKIVRKILPISMVVIEVAQFDIQKIKNPEIAGEDYQKGEQFGFGNVREYVLCRDRHMCQCCHGKSKDPVLNVHHIESRQTGGDSPDNLITLCKTCHGAYHRGEIKLPFKRNFKSLRDAAAMGSMRWELYKCAKRLWENVHLTYGYITKNTRINNGLEKSHRNDALCISGHPQASACSVHFQMRQVARHTRSLHVFTMSKGGVRRSAVAPHWIGDRFQRYDTVKWKGKTAFISGSTNGRPVLRDINWKLVTEKPSVNIKTVKFLCRKHGSFLIQMI